MFRFMLGACTVKDEWEAWPTLISKPMRVLRAWNTQTWDVIAGMAIVNVAIGAPVITSKYPVRDMAQYVSRAWDITFTFWSKC